MTMGYLVTPNEFRILEAFREMWGDGVPKFSDLQLREIVDLYPSA